MGMVCNGTAWVMPTYNTPSISHPIVSAGMMYDAFGASVTIPATYKNIGYMYNLGGWNSFEIALNSVATVIEGTGGLLSFQKPGVGATTSVNTDQLDRWAATALDFGTDPATGMSWGRWAGGTISQIAIGGTPTGNTTQSGSLHWFSTGTQTQAVTLPVTGTWNYTLMGRTSPTDNTGAIGTLNSASFSANFTAQTVNVGVNVTVNANTLNAVSTGVPILAGGNFKDSAPVVTCMPACGSTAGSVIGGQFSAPTGQGVGIGYGLVNGAQTVSGTAVFRQQ
jgi:hypothetical protein